MSDHAILSPSSADRWMSCPGSVREAKKFDDVSGASAIDGTHTHTLVETCILADLDSPLVYVGNTLSDHEGEFVVDDDRAERAGVMIDYIKLRMDEMVRPVVIRAESKVDPGAPLGRNDMHGTSDCILVGAEEIEIIDYKDGYRFVEASSRQNKLYGCGVLDQYDWKGFTNVKLTIVQPNNRINGLEPIRSFDSSIGELETWLDEEVRPAAFATDNPAAPLNAGEKQCLWCPARHGCTTLLNHTMDAAGLSFPKLSEEAATEDPAGYTDAEILKLMEAAPLLKLLIKAVEEEAVNRMVKSNNRIGGLKVIRGRGSNGWSSSNEDDVIALLGKCGIPKTQCKVAKVLSPAQARRLSWSAKKAGKDVMKSLGKNQLKRLEEYIVKTEGSLKVVLESDPGKAIEVVETSQFDSVAAPSIPDWLKPKE